MIRTNSFILFSSWRSLRLGGFLILCLFITANLHAATKVAIALNWVPEPEFGGIYAAKLDGSFDKHNLDADIQPGGAGAPTWQLVATGKVDFAVSSADEVVIARSQGADVVALFATYQTCPQGIMVHQSRGLKNLADALKSGGTLAIEPGLPYTKFLENKYGFANVKRISYDGGVANFLADKNFMQQCFITSEPLSAQQAGSDPQTFLISESGYNPYTAVIITRGDFLKQHSDTAIALIQSLKDGWRDYLDNPKPANDAMAKINKAMDPDTFSAAAAAQKPLIETDQTKSQGLGTMNADRWTTLVQQLADLKIIDKPIPAEECFVRLEK